MRGFWIFYFVGILAASSYAQADTLRLPVVSVTDSLMPAGGIYVAHWVRAELPVGMGANVGDLLSSESMVFVRQAGPGQVATVSQSGGTAAQLTVLWNGLPIQSPMLGLQDFSLLPAAAFDEISLTSGGTSSVYGTSGISGALQLRQTRPDSTFELEVGSQWGSFGANTQLLRWSQGGGAWRWRVYGQQRRMDNDYPVRPPNFWVDSRLPHAAWQQRIAQAELYRTLGPRNELALRYWYQDNERELPPTLRQRQSLATQRDDSHRLALSWQRRQRKGVFALQMAWFRESIRYRDPLIGFDAPSAYDSYLADLKTDHQLNAYWRLRAGLQLQWTQAEAQEYGASQDLGRLAAHATLTQTWRTRPWTTDWSGRMGSLTTGQPLWSMSWRTASAEQQAWQWSLRLGRDFRLPGLNDLFWRPGGKADLQPEVAYAQETALHYRPGGWGHWQLTAFNRWVRNWIQWSQLNSGVFAVDNINRVWSRGGSLRWQQQVGGWQLGAHAQYLRSTYQRALENPRIERGEQLWYTPSWQLGTSLGWQEGGWQLHYQHQYTGRTAGISADVAAYHLGSFRLRYQSQWDRFPWRLRLALHNCWNAPYEVVEFRPMPGRQLEVGINLKIIK